MASATLPTRALTAALFTLLAWVVNPLTTQAQLPDYLPAEGLVGWWPFNGNANDESGNGNDGVVNGATLTFNRFQEANRAYYFSSSGCGTRIDASVNTLSIQTGLTISVWVSKVGNGCIGPRLFEFWPGSDGPGQAQWGWDNSTSEISLGSTTSTGFVCTYGAPVPPLNEWTHLVYTNNGVVGTFYQDGVLIGTVNSTGNPILAGNLAIGRMNHPAFDAFNGMIDDFGLWNRALNPEEITALYTSTPAAAPCADPTACNFEQEGECVYAEPNLDCAGNCLNDCNNNGVCDEVEVYGCKYPTACNYNPEATSDDDSCTFTEFGYDCDGNCLLDLNNNGLCDLEEAAGCTNIDAINFDPSATLDNGTCMLTCKGDFNKDGTINVNDLLGFLAVFGNQCEGAGCMDPAGCNYDPNATFNLDFCEYPALYFNCDGTPVNDADGDGVPDELEVLGCTNAEACNYDVLATDDNGSCELPAEFFNCDGTPLNDTDGDGIPNELEVPGCNEAGACNFMPAATENDGSCDYISCISIGSPLGGGILGYLFQPGDPGYDPAVPHGIIVSNTDLGIATWGCVNTLIGASSMTLGQAASNTSLITAGCAENNIAARLCENYSSGGFSDWYLPTYWDLVKIYQNLHAQGLGGFQSNYYWTSTELNAYSANLIYFQNGQGIDFAKSFVSGRVRAIRYF